jgi:hypothetical protein
VVEGTVERVIASQLSFYVVEGPVDPDAPDPSLPPPVPPPPPRRRQLFMP